MRDRMELPGVFEPAYNGYFLRWRSGAFPTVQISEGELFAMLVAEKAMQQYRGTNFEKPLVSAFRKVTDSLTDTLSFNLDDFDQSISFRTSAEPVLNLDVIDALAKATAGHRQLPFNYRKPGPQGLSPRLSTRTIWPTSTANGSFSRIATCATISAPFTPARNSDMKPTGKTFKPPKKFSLEKRLRGSFAIVTGEKEQEIVIRFNELVADYIREKRWHPTEKQRNLRTAGWIWAMRLDSLSEVQRWVMTWCGNARSSSPPSWHNPSTKLPRESSKPEPQIYTKEHGLFLVG
ncbi:MAG: hypothetical protein CM1200mP34_4210 [Verrucomicrobiales bacterium]|nr:MAG: hypothetical protein CM1200mP34_4210 [Verrucomicrobiales bacterium]